MKSERRVEKLSRALRYSQPDLTVVLENIHDPHNVSAVLRTCDAVGIRTVNLLYTAESFPKIGRKSSASANKWVARKNFRSVKTCYDSLRADGFIIAASVVGEKSVSLYEMDLRQKIALVFGNEHRGVTEDAASFADLRFQIPMYGMVQSLNVSVACAITLYEALRQRMTSGDHGRQKISKEELQRLLDEWIKK
ncbi:MAG: RNA methyltransferase [Bacteroidetes bacterium]|nr:RNA methyltransferase [Bacteroidota bacterium]MCL5738082.1 RNA methyltransferase [Bacteroidota bacterium]